MFNKRRVRLIDGYTTSTIVSGVSIESWGDPKIYHVLVEMRLTDCSRSIAWDNFGDTEQEALDKADEVISAMLALKADIKEAYTDMNTLSQDKGDNPPENK